MTVSQDEPDRPMLPAVARHSAYATSPSVSLMRALLFAVAAATIIAIPVAAADPVVAGPPARLPASPMAGYFQLRDPSGHVIDTDSLLGTSYGVFFGFTHCPDICPTTLAQLSLALSRVPDPDIRIYFVTVDPERDTPATLASFLTSFDPRIVALTGTAAAIQEATSGFGIVAQRSELAGGGYVYGHTASILFVDANGLIVDQAAADADVDALAKRVRRLSRSQPNPVVRSGP